MPPKRRPEIVHYVPSTSESSSSTVPNPPIKTHHTHYEPRRRPVRSTVVVDRPVRDTSNADPPAAHLTFFAVILDDDGMEKVECDGQELEIHGLAVHDSTEASTPKVEEARKRRRTQADHPLLTWIEHVDCYLGEFLRLEGRGDARDQVHCAGEGCEVKIESGGHRCEECQDSSLYCKQCIVKRHYYLPFHRVQIWNGLHFDRVSLKSLGLRIQLGHRDSRCGLPQSAFNDDFTVIHTNGIHEVAMDYCGCRQSLPKTVQLLRARLFPSTVIDPKTASSFQVLDTFQMLSFTSKVSAYEFYQALARATDNTGTCPPPDRYHGFRRMVREWRHIRLLKRSGRGHDPTGSKGTKEGECAVLCPACPIPGVNLPEDWKARPSTEQWLYSAFVAIDANFRLKRMNISNDERDPGLNRGYAYIVENQKFEKYLEDYGQRIPNDKSSCNNHDAIKSASMRGGKGTAASGVGAVECSRHDMKRPTAVGDLQKGERYVNMDYFFLSTLQHYDYLRLVVSYDIACQWSQKLYLRCRTIYPENRISTIPPPEMVFLVPKFHLPAHVTACQTNYSFNLTPGVGRTDGEAPERGWSAANALAASTREMGPGSRRDTLDDHFGDYNWRKITAFGETFARKADEAIKARQEHVEAFVEFDAALPEESTRAWTQLCQKWEKDRSSENPFHVVQTAATDSEVRLRLAQDDIRAIELGTQPIVHAQVAPGLFVYLGLEIEDLQRKLASETAELGSHATSLQKAKILERSNTLKRRIDAWIEIQHLYIPQLASVRAAADQEGGGKPLAVHNIELYLPSQIHSFVKCDILLLQNEWDLRYAQAHTTLNDLRGLLLMESMMYKSKARYSRGQRQQTRSVNLIKRVRIRIEATATKYRHIRNSLQSLAGPLLQFEWGDVLKVLEEDDMATLTSLDDETGEGRKKLKWIWTVQGTGANADHSTQSGESPHQLGLPGRTTNFRLALRVEWCKSRARAHRWQEECLLLDEEMRRILVTFGWQSEKWKNVAQELEAADFTSSKTLTALVQADIAAQAVEREGKIAYAYRQAAIRDGMANHCKLRWEKYRIALLTLDGFDSKVMVECHGDAYTNVT